MDFTAIDFETANHRRDSACQLAAVVVRDGVVVGQQMWMIKPRPFFFSARNIEVHGIRPQQVQFEREFGELWESIAPLLSDGCLVAHNASFDLGVLLECIKAHGHQVPKFQFTCTRLIARAAWPGQSGYGLKRIADWLGIRFRHHDALEDSLACAKILLAAASAKSASTLEELETKLKLVRGHADQSGYRGATKQRQTRRQVSPRVRSVSLADHDTRASCLFESSTPYAAGTTTTSPHECESTFDMQRLYVRAEFLRRLAGKHVVFTGRMRQVSREQAEQLATRLGATLHECVTTQTDIVFVGSPDADTRFDSDTHSRKEQMALMLQSEGHPVQLLTESDLLEMVTSAAKE